MIGTLRRAHNGEVAGARLHAQVPLRARLPAAAGAMERRGRAFPGPWAKPETLGNRQHHHAALGPAPSFAVWVASARIVSSLVLSH